MGRAANIATQAFGSNTRQPGCDLKQSWRPWRPTRSGWYLGSAAGRLLTTIYRLSSALALAQAALLHDAGRILRSRYDPRGGKRREKPAQLQPISTAAAPGTQAPLNQGGEPPAEHPRAQRDAGDNPSVTC